MKNNNVYTASLAIRMMPGCFVEPYSDAVANTYFIIHDALHFWLDIPPAGIENEAQIDLAESVLGKCDTDCFSPEEVASMSALIEANIPADQIVFIKNFFANEFVL